MEKQNQNPENFDDGVAHVAPRERFEVYKCSCGATAEFQCDCGELLCGED